MQRQMTHRQILIRSQRLQALIQSELASGLPPVGRLELPALPPPVRRWEV